MNPKIKHSRDRAFKRFVYIFFFLMCACFVLPLIVVISASFTSEQACCRVILRSTRTSRHFPAEHACCAPTA